ncbi:hypothetical protein [Paratractidigestivibacter sp.]|uniref:hypothetical protein n=1 Tax=Paratractidigestivibacter sp. TaxID=2847316 RepID=UPI002AC9497A|nr:hypothetical protein [Paratractidigestivibacter sp.]
MLKATWEFDFYRCLEFSPAFYGKTVSALHAGNLRTSKDGRYAHLFPGDRVSYWAGDRATAVAEVRKYGAGLDLITFWAYDDASSTFPTTECTEPLIIVDGCNTGFVTILEKLDREEGLSPADRELISKIQAERPDCLIYESHAKAGGYNFLFFEKGFSKLSLREVRLRLERRDEKAQTRKVNRACIRCATTSDYMPNPRAYGKGFQAIARTFTDEDYVNTDEYIERSKQRWHQPYAIR